MSSEALGPLVAGACFLLSAASQRLRWRLGAWLALAGSVILAGAMVGRGLRAGHWPLASDYEFALALALSIALAALALDLRSALRSPAVQAGAMSLAAAMVIYARLLMPAYKRAPRPLPPVLDTPWLPLHVGTAALAYGMLAVAGAAGLVWLVHPVDRRRAGWMLARATALGYPLLTLSLILSLIWAQMAWGRYWGWDLKEVWSLIIWLLYTLYWHVQQRPAWQGRRLAWLALLGLGAILFTFLALGWLAQSLGLSSLHLF